MSKVYFVVIFLALLTVDVFAKEKFVLWGNLQPGPHPVGYQVKEKYDYSRTYRPKYDYEGNLIPGERARPIQIHLWYPSAAKEQSDFQLFEQYVQWTVSEDQPGKSDPKEAINKFLQSYSKDTSPEQIQSLLKTKTATILNAEPTSGPHPLILFAQGHNLPSPWSHSVLCEYLASHGFIVVSSPGLGDKQKQLDRKDPLTQLNDLQFLIAEMRNIPAVDQNKLAVVGYGLGGLTGVILAMNHSNVDALVSLDGMMATKHGYSLLFQHPLYKPTRFYIPMLHVSDSEKGDQSDDTFFTSAKYSNLYRLKFKGMRGSDYTSIAVLSSDDKKQAYENMCLYVQHFLSGYMLKNAESIAFLKQPPAIAQLEFKQGFRRPPSEEEFVEILNEKGIDNAKQIYQEVIKNDPDYRLFNSDSLSSVAKKMLQSGKTKEAIEVLQLNLEAHPDEWRVLDALGNAHMTAGDKAAAIEYFGKSLEINPENSAATEMLKKLKESP